MTCAAVKAALMQGFAVLGSAQADLFIRGRSRCRLFDAQRRDELVQEQGNSGFQLEGGYPR
jgi:hypothetical protein